MTLNAVCVWLLAWPNALWKEREILWTLSRREVNQKYKGSGLGIAWSIITPLAMLTVYTFVFTGIFKARWPGANADDPLSFGMNLFAGLIVFNTFSEVMTRAPDAMHISKNLVTKVVFPLETITVSYVVASMIQACVSLSILLAALIISSGTLTIQWFGIFLVWIPLLNFNIALGWILSSLGVYSRDISHVAAVSTNFILFMSAVFYPISALPDKIQWLAELNPIAIIIVESRDVLISRNIVDPHYFILATLLSYFSCCIAYGFFKKSSNRFSDYI